MKRFIQSQLFGDLMDMVVLWAIIAFWVVVGLLVAPWPARGQELPTEAAIVRAALAQHVDGVRAIVDAHPGVDAVTLRALREAADKAELLRQGGFVLPDDTEDRRAGAEMVRQQRLAEDRARGASELALALAIELRAQQKAPHPSIAIPPVEVVIIYPPMIVARPPHPKEMFSLESIATGDL